jgi:hypothetical protein
VEGDVEVVVSVVATAVSVAPPADAEGAAVKLGPVEGVGFGAAGVAGVPMFAAGEDRF